MAARPLPPGRPPHCLRVFKLLPARQSCRARRPRRPCRRGTGSATKGLRPAGAIRAPAPRGFLLAAGRPERRCRCARAPRPGERAARPRRPSRLPGAAVPPTVARRRSGCSCRRARRRNLLGNWCALFASQRLLVELWVLPHAAFANAAGSGPGVDCSEQQKRWEANCIFRY